MVNYKNGKIYKIVCNSTGDVYFGSTTQQKLASRMNTHRKHTSNLLSKIIIQRHNYSYCLVEKYECDNHDELYCRLRYYIDNYDCINKQTTSNNKHIDNEPKKHIDNEPKKAIVNKPTQPKIIIQPQKKIKDKDVLTKTHEAPKEVSLKYKSSTEKDIHSYTQINTKCLIDRRTRKNHHLLHFNKDVEHIKPQLDKDIEHTKQQLDKDIEHTKPQLDKDKENTKQQLDKDKSWVERVMKRENKAKDDEVARQLHQDNIDKIEKDRIIKLLPRATINKHNNNNLTLKRVENQHNHKPHNKTLKITEKIDVLDMLDYMKEYKKEQEEIM